MTSDTETRDPYADCVCGHGRHTHAHYTGSCGLCDCVYVRESTPADTARKAETMNKTELDPKPWRCALACDCGRRARRVEQLRYWPHYPLWSPREGYSQDPKDYGMEAGGPGVE